MTDRVLLLIPTTSYKAEDFIAATQRLGVQVIVGTDRQQVLETAAPGHTLSLDFANPERSVQRVVKLAAEKPLGSVIGSDDETTLLAAMAASTLGLRHNSVQSIRATRDKYETRRKLSAAGLRGPDFKLVSLSAPPAQTAREMTYPCVLKPLFLSASRGVLRVDDPDAFAQAFDRIAAILKQPDVSARGGDTNHLLVEEYLPGDEVAVEGLLDGDRLRILALFDKPDPLEGPTFEETLYVTPSRHTATLQEAVAAETMNGCRALGLQEGPVHAELRLHDGKPWVLEIAARTIGGLCSRGLRFGAGISLEELILRHALGWETATLELERGAAGIMMIPIPQAGVLEGVEGLDRAREVPGIEEITISIHRGAELIPLPEGHRYLGFIFARSEKPEEVETALRQAHSRLHFQISSR